MPTQTQPASNNPVLHPQPRSTHKRVHKLDDSRQNPKLVVRTAHYWADRVESPIDPATIGMHADYFARARHLLGDKDYAGGLIEALQTKYYNYSPGLIEEACWAAVFGLIEGSNYADVDHLGAYLWTRSEWRIGDAMDRDDAEHAAVSRAMDGQLTGWDEEDEDGHAPRVRTVIPNYLYISVLKWLYRLRRRAPLDAALVIGYSVFRFTIRELADRVGRSPSWVSQRLNRLAKQAQKLGFDAADFQSFRDEVARRMPVPKTWGRAHVSNARLLAAA